MNPRIVIACKDNTFIRMMHFIDAGDVELGHEHAFGHLTFLAHGALRVKVNGRETDYRAPTAIWIAPDTVHELTALEGDTKAACIHALRDKETHEVLDPASIPAGVDPTAVAARLLR